MTDGPGEDTRYNSAAPTPAGHSPAIPSRPPKNVAPATHATELGTARANESGASRFTLDALDEQRPLAATEDSLHTLVQRTAEAKLTGMGVARAPFTDART